MNNNTLSNHPILDEVLQRAYNNGRTVTVELDSGWRYTGTPENISDETTFWLWTSCQYVQVLKDDVMLAGVN